MRKAHCRSQRIIKCIIEDDGSLEFSDSKSSLKEVNANILCLFELINTLVMTELD